MRRAPEVPSPEVPSTSSGRRGDVSGGRDRPDTVAVRRALAVPSTSSDRRDGGGVGRPRTVAVLRAPAAPSTYVDRRGGGGGGGRDRPDMAAVRRAPAAGEPPGGGEPDGRASGAGEGRPAAALGGAEYQPRFLGLVPSASTMPSERREASDGRPGPAGVRRVPAAGEPPGGGEPDGRGPGAEGGRPAVALGGAEYQPRFLGLVPSASTMPSERREAGDGRPGPAGVRRDPAAGQRAPAAGEPPGGGEPDGRGPGAGGGRLAAALGPVEFLGLVPSASTPSERREAGDGQLGPAVVRRVLAAVRPARPAPAARAVTGRRPLVVRTEWQGIIVVESPGGEGGVIFCFCNSPRGGSSWAGRREE